MTRYFPLDEYESRWARVQREMRLRGFPVAVVLGRSGGSHDHCGDVLYLANHYAVSSGLDSRLWSARSFAGVILEDGQLPELHIDEPDPRLDILATDRVSWHYHPIRGIAEALRRRGVTGPVALVGTNFLPVKYYAELQELCPGITWVPADDLVRTVRRVKSPSELDCCREAGDIASAGLTRLMEGLARGLPEAQAAADAAQVVIRRGGRIQLLGCTHGDTIGHLCRNPLTGYSQDAPASGDLVSGVVHGPMHQGYYMDPARTWVAAGRPTTAQRMLVEATGDLVRRLIDAIKPGVRLIDVARLGDRLTREFGGDASPATQTFPFYGHGVGLFFEEPRIGTGLSDEDDVFEAGMVLGVEAFLARDGVGSTSVEDNVIVHADHNELLTTTPLYCW